jgi:hypothetical protein
MRRPHDFDELDERDPDADPYRASRINKPRWDVWIYNQVCLQQLPVWTLLFCRRLLRRHCL